MSNSVDEKKIVLITGASRGIGHYLAEYYLRKEYFVIGCSRGNSDITDPNYRHYIVDVCDEKQVVSLFRDIKRVYGYLNILINNAGIASYNHSMLTNVSTVKKILDTNIVGTFLFCKEAAKLMKDKMNGRIINISTVLVPMKLEGEAIYVASKAAVNSLTEILAKEFNGFRITVNAVAPTPIMTNLIKHIPKDKIDSLVDKIPMKRLGEFADVSNVIDFFIKPESDFINGQIIYLGGV